MIPVHKMDFMLLQSVVHKNSSDFQFPSLIPVVGAAMTTVEGSHPTTNLYDGDYRTFALSSQSDLPPISKPSSSTFGQGGFAIMINLGLSYKIRTVRLINRFDGERGTITGFNVYIVKFNGTKIELGRVPGGGRADYTFRKGGIGDKVEISKDETVHSVNLAEVEVYGVLGKSAEVDLSIKSRRNSLHKFCTLVISPFTL